MIVAIKQKIIIFFFNYDRYNIIGIIDHYINYVYAIKLRNLTEYNRRKVLIPSG